MKSSLKLALLVGASSLVLAACGGGGGGNGSVSRDIPVVVSVQAQLGSAFEQIFGSDPNSPPTDPVPDNAVAAISFTDDPIPVP